MTFIDALTWLSFLIGVISIILALYTMRMSHLSEARSKENFDRTQAMMQQFHDKTKDLLNEVDKRTVVIEKVVATSQEKLLNTITSIVNETVLPKKVDMGEQLGMKFFEKLLTDPKQAKELMEGLKPFIEMAEKEKGKEGKQ